MLGFIATSTEESNPVTTPSPAEAPTNEAPLPEKKDASTGVHPTANPTVTVTGVDSLTSEPSPTNIAPAPSTSQLILQPVRVFVESKGTQTLHPPTPPASQKQSIPSLQFRSLSAPLPGHTQDSTQASSLRRGSKLDPLPPLPESVYIPLPVKPVLPGDSLGSNKSALTGVSDVGSREGGEAESSAGARKRSGSAVMHVGTARNSVYPENEFGVLEKEKPNNTSLSLGTTIRGSKHYTTLSTMTGYHSSTSRKTLGERLQPTLDTARSQRTKYEAKARRTGIILNAAIGAQVLLGALTTGLAGIGAGTGKNTAGGTVVLGGLSTLVASYLARVRGSSEPELSITRVKDLEAFSRECEAFVMDYGHVVIEDDGDGKADPAGKELEQRVFRLRERFEELLGNGSGERKLSPPV